jgi:hypothetical protein
MPLKEGPEFLRVVKRAEEQRRLLKGAHIGLAKSLEAVALGGNFGRDKTLWKLVDSGFWWIFPSKIFLSKFFFRKCFQTFPFENFILGSNCCPGRVRGDCTAYKNYIFGRALAGREEYTVPAPAEHSRVTATRTSWTLEFMVP